LFPVWIVDRDPFLVTDPAIAYWQDKPWFINFAHAVRERYVTLMWVN
jgi:hypothetical protein